MAEPPSAISTHCPGCGQETLHTVLRGTMGTKGAFVTIDATVQCSECQHTHHVVMREPKPVEVPVVVSRAGQSVRAKVELSPEDEVTLGEALVVEGKTCKLTGIEAKDLRRVEDARVAEVLTLWAKEFEEIAVGFAINLGKKTITKVVAAPPGQEFSVGEEFVFGRLRVTVHAIKTEERLVKRGSAEAGEIKRVFAQPTPLGGEKYRPPKAQRDQSRRDKERAAGGVPRGRRQE
ncbi:MAG: hypothetical protein QOE90_1619 [Thermoplasmata archaeon]|jgi:uncharacterized Zn finger protein|nr:hypothetical protein [Thermoplasmata archaeon]